MEEEEIWAKVPNYNNYYVSNLGNIKNVKTKNMLKLIVRAKPPKDYLFVHLSENNKQKYFFIHALVMVSFVGERGKDMVINHINGNKRDNRLINLEYCTQSHNRKQDFIHGRQSFVGEKNTQSKLTETDVLNILELRSAGQGIRKIANEYNVGDACIHRIISGKGWNHVTKIVKTK
jgi:hypothetical protein